MTSNMIPKYCKLLVLCCSLLSISHKHIAEGLTIGSGKRIKKEYPEQWQFPDQWQGSSTDAQNAVDRRKGRNFAVRVSYVEPDETKICDNIEVTCTIDTKDDASLVDITLLVNGKIHHFTKESRLRNISISIGCSPENLGIVTCEITVLKGGKSFKLQDKTEFEFPTEPKVSVYGDAKPIGSRAVITCVAKGNPLSDVLWYFNNDSLDPGTLGIERMIAREKYEIHDLLVFPSVRKEHNGTYSCKVEGISQDEKTAVLLVEALPNVSETSSALPNVSETSSTLPNVNETSSALPNMNETSSLRLKSTSVMLAGIVFTVILVLVIVFAFLLVKKRRTDAKKMRPMKFFGSRRITGNAIIKETEAGLEVRSYENYRYRMWAVGAIETGWRNYEKSDSEWEVPRSSIKMLEILGTGFFGQVWKCSLKNFKGSSGETIAAVKTLKEVVSDNNRYELLAEIEVMKRLGSHPHVVSFLGCSTDRDPILLLLEYVPGGKLQTYLRKSRGNHEYYNLHGVSSLTSTELLVFGYQAARGMEYLSFKGIVHRDLAARNILIDDNTKTCKVADFGLARDLENSLVYEKKSDGKIPIRWLPPESLFDNVFTTKSDVWSFGVLLWEIVALGSTPYPGLSANEVMKRIPRGYRLEKPEYCLDELYDAMQWCWKKDPEERPSFSEIVQYIENLLECGLEYINLKEVNDHCLFTDIAENSEEKV